MMSPSKMTKPSGGAGAGVGISPPRHDQLGRPIPPTARPGTQAQAPGQGQCQPRSNPTSPATGSPTRKGTSSPNANGSGFRPNNPFAQRQYQRQQAQQQSPRQGFSIVDPSHPALEGTRRPAGRASDPQVHSPSPLSSPLPLSQSPTTGTGGPGTQPLDVPPRRRLLPSENDHPSPIQAGITPPGRRPVPAMTSPEMSASGIPRLTSPSQSPRMGQGIGLGMGMGMPMGLPTNLAMPVPRTTVRQPSTPALLGPIRKPVADHGNTNANVTSNNNISRPRAKSTATPSQINSTQQSQRQQNPLRNQKSHNPLPTSVEREAAVPPHIRIRLRLIHRLGVVLGVEPSVIASKIDIPALLARVDAAYDKGHGGFIDLPNQDSSPSIPTSVSTTTPAPGGKKEGGGMLGMFRKLGGGGHSNASANVGGAAKGTREEQQPLMPVGGQVPSDGPAFGVPLYEMPDNSWCTSLIGGQKHELPLVVFTVIEEIYRRGMSQPGIFRLAGDGTRISHLTKVFNMPPLYGDSLSISSEPIHNLTGLVKRYVRDMPEPILDESLFPAFMAFCLDPEEDVGSPTLSQDPPAVKPTPTTTTRPIAVRIAAAQILLRLLPPSHFSLFIYLLAFLGQLPLFPDNRLNVESISIIFGPAMVAARGKGIAGLGPNSSNSRPSCDGDDPERVSELVNTSQSVLGWLLRHWGMISEKVLDSISDAAAGGGVSSSGSTTFINSNLNGKGDPKLMAPINLKMSSVIPSDSSSSLSTFAIPPPPLSDPPSISPLGAQSRTPISTPRLDKSNSDSTNSSSSSGHSETTTPIPPPLSGRPEGGIAGGGKGGEGRPVSPAPSTRTGGLFSRAFSSRNISSQANSSDDNVPENKVKRSTSFTSISSMVKKGSGYLSKGVNIEAARSLSAEKLSVREPPPVSPTANPQISNVLGSLHDLLVSKDKQIERDARELALLRHTLLEMDEKLTKLSNSTSTSTSSLPSNTTNTTTKTAAATSASNTTTAPQITMTSTPSALQLSQAAQSEITDLQAQLTATLASLETCRLGSRVHERKILELEAKLSRADSARGVEVGKLKVELAIEQGKVVGMMEERDEARMRLEKIKTTLFAIS